MTDDAGDIAVLRTTLRGVNIEYSALVRCRAVENRFARMAQLRTERHALMARIAARTTRARGLHFPTSPAIHSAASCKHGWGSVGLDLAGPASRSFTRLRRLWQPWGPADVIARLRVRTRTLAHSLRGLA